MQTFGTVVLLMIGLAIYGALKSWIIRKLDERYPLGGPKR